MFEIVLRKRRMKARLMLEDMELNVSLHNINSATQKMLIIKNLRKLHDYADPKPQHLVVENEELYKSR